MSVRQPNRHSGTAWAARLALLALFAGALRCLPTNAAPPVAASGPQSAEQREAAGSASSLSGQPANSDRPNGAERSGADAASTTDATAAEPRLPLSAQQEAIAARYRRFETTLLQLAEYLRRTDPDRAELLVRAIGQSQEKRIREQMTSIVSLLSTGRLGDAVQRQDELIKSLTALLELLQSEDRRSSLEAERQRLKKLLAEVGRLIGEQKEARAANERGEPLDQTRGKQQRVADRTKGLLDEIQKHDQAEQAGDSSAGKPGKEEQGGSSSQDDKSRKPGDRSDRSPQEGAQPGQSGSENRKSGQQPSESGQPPKGSQQEGRSQPSPQAGEQSGPSQGGEGSSSGQSEPQQPDLQRQTPGREQLEQAYRQMKEALRKLQEQQRQKASEHQDEAVRKLVEAKEKLEEILRQLREEERGLLLTALEARFRKMLAMQELVYHQTVELSSVPDADRDASFNERARKLSFDENAIGLEADRALQLLRDEGSSVAFPQAVEDMRQDMETVTRRLERSDVGALTQSIEQDIIDALKEMLDALEKELADLQKQQQNQQQQQQQPGEPPLVDLLSELKMLKTLQVRINRRTKRIGKLLQGERATDPDLLQQLQELSEREAKVREATYDLLSGRNR